MPSIKYFISRKLNPENINELGKIEEEEKKLIEAKCFTKDIIKQMKIYLSNSKTTRAFGDGIRTSFMNMYTANDIQTIWESILKNLKARQDQRKILNFKK